MRRPTIGLLLAIPLLACRGEGPAPPPAVVTIIADDSAFIAPDTIPSGLTTLRLVTRGAQSHQVALARIGKGHTYAQFLEAMRAPPPPPAWIEMAGGVNPPAPGDTAEATFDLPPGRYALLCLVAGADGLPHVVHGMHRELIVSRSESRAAAEPVATDTLLLADGAITAGRPITGGRHTFRVVVVGPEPHELSIARLLPGRRADDMLRWLAHPSGAPPGVLMGGVFGMPPGRFAFVTVDLAPGDYLFFCTLLAASDGKPWYTHGMVREVSVSRAAP